MQYNFLFDIGIKTPNCQH